MRTLIQFSGLSWNLKTTIVDDLMKDLFPIGFLRMEQTNKSHQDKEKTPSPRELQSIFLSANRELIEQGTHLITDRAPIDYDIYNIMMDPMYAHCQFEYRSPNVYNSHVTEVYGYLMGTFYKKFDKVITVSLQTSNRKFIISTFNKQPESSTAYLFDNPNKYFYYSNYFNELSDHIHNKLMINVNTRGGVEFHRLFYKFTDSDTPKEFIERVKAGVRAKLVENVQKRKRTS